MKKLILCITILVSCLSLCSCSMDPQVRHVEKLISVINSDNNKDIIIQANNAYNSLSEEQKERVSNYSTLLDAKNQLLQREFYALSNVFTICNLKCDWVSSVICDIWSKKGSADFEAYFDAILTVGDPNNLNLSEATMWCAAEALHPGKYKYPILDSSRSKIMSECEEFAGIYNSLLKSDGLPDNINKFVTLFGEDYPEQAKLIQDWSAETDLYINLCTAPYGTLYSYSNQLDMCKSNLLRYQSKAKTFQ